MNREKKLSVLMSVYNETLGDITEAIESVLSQTFPYFEFLIVDDNPARSDHRFLLEEYKRKDSRIIIIKNEKNIGLAMSMNKAALNASGDVFVRMDADDICLPTRFDDEYRLLCSQNCDVICGRYTVMDDNSIDISSYGVKPEYTVSNMISETLPYKSVIHHPTVMMTRRIFERVNGYRNFPCAQDFDLWLRMMDANATFAMIDKVVLRYRLRSSSVSVSKRIRQRITVEYIRDLYIERLRTGCDSFSEEHYQNYLKKNIKDEEMDSALIDQGNVIINKAKLYDVQGKRLYSVLLRSKLLLCNRVYRHVFFKLWRSKRAIKRLKSHNIVR